MKWILLISMLAAFALDQLSKYWVVAVAMLPTRPPLVVNEFLSLVMVWNRGVSFGMFSDSDSRVSVLVLVAVSLVISAILVRLALQSARCLEVAAYGMIVGGALGNALDRVRVGAVADFIYVHVGDVGWPAFNLADSAICVGVGFLLLHVLKNSKVAA